LRYRLAFAAAGAILFAAGPAAAMPPLAGAIVAAVVTAVISTVAAFALNMIVSVIFKKPTPSMQHPQQQANDRNNSYVDSKTNIKEPAGPWRVIYGETRVGNNMLFAHASSRLHMHLVLAVAHHECEAFHQVWIGDEVHWTQEAVADGVVPDPLPDKNFVLDADGFPTGGFTFGAGFSLIRFKFHHGAPGQAHDADLVAEVNNNDLVSATDNFEGIAYCYVRLQHGPVGEQMPVFADGIPAFSFLVRGKKCLDPRDGITRWTNNSALCAYDYMIDPLIGPKIDPANIYTAEVEAAADICEEQVEVGGVGSGLFQDRYTCNGAFTLDTEPQETLNKILGSMRGHTPHDGDKWRMLAGAYYEPVGTLTQDDFRLGPTINTVLSRRERFNSVKGTFVGYDNNWNETDFPPYSNPAWVTDDEGEVWNDLQLPFTNDAAMAQRLARLELELSRRELTMTLHCKLPAWVYQAGDNIEISHDVYTYLNDKVFEIQEVRLVVDPESGDQGVDLEVIETSAASFFWDGSEEIPSTPNGPGGNNPDVTTVDPVTNLTATEQVYTASSGGGVKSRLIIEWDAPVDELIAGYQVEYKLQAASTWIVLPRVPAGTEEARIEDIPVGLYHVRVATVNIVNLLSTYVQIGVTVSGDTTPPEDVTGFVQVAGISGFSNFHWNGATEQRVRDGGATIIKYQAVTSGAAWNSGAYVFVGDGIVQDAVLVTAVGTFMIKFQSATGVQSVNFASVVITTLEQPKVGVDIVATLPGSGDFQGQIVFNEADNKLYRWTGSAWTSAVPTTDLTGTITDAQIAAMAAAKLTGQITTTQITDDAVTTPKVAAGAVITEHLAAATITAEKMLIGNFENMVANPNFVNGVANWGVLVATYDNWQPTLPTDITLLTGTGGYAGSQHVLQFEATYDYASDGVLWNSAWFSVTGGEKYVLRTATMRRSGLGTHVRYLAIEIEFLKFDTTVGGGTWVAQTPVDARYVLAPITDPLDTWVVRDSDTYHGIDNITVPAGATRARVFVHNEAGGNLGGAYWLGLVSVFRRNDSHLIVDGGIIAKSLATDSVTANKILAGAVTAAKISVSSLSAVSADVGSVTAGTITGNLIRTTTAIERVEIAAGGTYPNKVTAYGDVGSGVSGALGFFGGTIAGAGGLLSISIPNSTIYPMRLFNTSTSGGGGGLGGGTAVFNSVAGFTIEVNQTDTGAGSPLPTQAGVLSNNGAGGGSVALGRSAGAGGWAAYSIAGGYGPFTGAHDAIMAVAIEPMVGDLLVDVEVIASYISDSMTRVELSSSPRQKTVVGAYVSRQRPVAEWAPASMVEDDLVLYDIGTEEEPHLIPNYPPVAEWVTLIADNDLVVINALGEGAVRCCDEGGNLAPGDLLCSSSVPGKAMRQLDDLGNPDDVVRSYTIGKVRGGYSHTFSGPGDFPLVPIFYYSG